MRLDGTHELAIGFAWHEVIPWLIGDFLARPGLSSVI
jgi:hypothetical protein